MNYHVITIFPEMFTSYLGESILARAIKEKKISVKFYNPRDFARPAKFDRSGVKDNGYRPVDDKPYGGGPGMVMRAEPIIKAVEQALKKVKDKKKVKIIHFAPSAKKFETIYAKNLVKKKYTDIIFICGRYEGIDARVKKIFKGDEISIGDYVLTGGELPAMVMIDSISRQIPGVLGKYESLEEERISSSEFYTRPEILIYTPEQGKTLLSGGGKKYRVPKVLLSGNHAEIDKWKQKGK